MASKPKTYNKSSPGRAPSSKSASAAARPPVTRKASSASKASAKPRSAKADSRVGMGPGDVGITLSPATEAYSHAILNPSDAPAAGMPVTGIPSEKNKCWVRGTLTTSSTGFGFIVCSPAQSMVSGGVCITTNDPAIAGGANSISTSPVAGTNLQYSTNSPYVAGQFGATAVRGRFVAGEIRIRYIGTALNRGGDVIVYCEPNHNDLTGATTQSLLTNASAGRAPISMTEWISCKYAGVVDPTEENFVASITSSIVKNANNCMCMIINSAAPASKFDFEGWFHFEIIGNVSASLVTTQPDPVGHTAVNGAAQAAQVEHAGTHEHQDYMKSAFGKILHTISTGASRFGDIVSHAGTLKAIGQGVEKYMPKIMGGVVKYGAPLAIAAL